MPKQKRLILKALC